MILITLGWSLASSPLALAGTVALMLVLESKSRLEESMLVQRFPEYDAYRHESDGGSSRLFTEACGAASQGRAPRAEPLHVLTLPDFERAEQIGES